MSEITLNEEIYEECINDLDALGSNAKCREIKRKLQGAKIRVCRYCKQTLTMDDFYKFKDGTHSHTCRACEVAFLDIYKPYECKNIFVKYNIPLIYEEWIKKVNYRSTRGKEVVFGSYLETMKLRGFRDYGFEDSDELNFLRAMGRD